MHHSSFGHHRRHTDKNMAGVSPVKSISIRADASGKRSFHVKKSANVYRCISNFCLSIQCFVEFPSNLTRYNGYILHVQRKDDISMACFVTCSEMSFAKQFKSAINRTFASVGGVLWETVSDSQLCQFMMRATEDFFSQPPEEQKRLQAAFTVGKQPNDDIYVLGDVQLDSQGKLISEDNRRYIWMVPHLIGVPSTHGDSLLREYLKSTPPVIEVPLSTFNWLLFMKDVKNFTNNNFYQFLMMLSGAVSAFHYEKVLSIIGSCPAPMAVGEPASGKSSALRLIHALIGGTFLSQSSSESVSSELVKSTLPVYWDDPSHPNILRNVLVSTFQGGGKQTKTSGNEVPKSTFLLTVNFKLDNDLRAFERTTPIFFDKIVTGEKDDFFESRKATFRRAGTNCLPSIIQMGDLTEAGLEAHVKFFKERLHGSPSRLPLVYSMYRHFAFKIISLVADNAVASEEAFDAHLQEKLIPYVRDLYQQSSKIKATLDDFCSDIVDAVKKGHSPEDVTTWLKPCIPQRLSPHGPALHLHRQKVAALLQKAGTPYSGQEIKNIIGATNGGNSDFRTKFESNSRSRVPSLKIPRESISQDLLRVIDSWCDIEVHVADEEGQEEEEEAEPCTNCKMLQNDLKKEKELFKKTEIEYLDEITQLKEALKKERNTSDTLRDQLIAVKRNINVVSTEKTEASQKDASKDDSVTGNGNVLHSLASIISRTPQMSKRSCDESGFMEDDTDNETSPMYSSTPTGTDNPGNSDKGCKRKLEADPKGHCNLCMQKKKSGMIKCNHCEQWQHSKCAGVSLKEYNIHFKCVHCNKGHN